MAKPIRKTPKLPTSEGQDAVDSALAATPPAVRAALEALRTLILDTASAIPDVGRVEQALKWGQPSFLTAETGSGSTIRIDALKGRPSGYAIYFHCRTDLVETFRRLYPDTFRFEGNRAIHFDADIAIPAEALKHCVALALTYHARGKRSAR